MKTWKTPRVDVEKFEANEYVSACFTVKCENKHKINSDNKIEYFLKIEENGSSLTYSLKDANGNSVGYNYYLSDNNPKKSYSSEDRFWWRTETNIGTGYVQHYSYLSVDSTSPNRS